MYYALVENDHKPHHQICINIESHLTAEPESSRIVQSAVSFCASRAEAVT